MTAITENEIPSSATLNAASAANGLLGLKMEGIPTKRMGIPTSAKKVTFTNGASLELNNSNRIPSDSMARQTMGQNACAVNFAAHYQVEC